MTIDTTTVLITFTIIAGIFLAYILFEPWIRRDPTIQKPANLGKKSWLIDEVNGFKARIIYVKKEGSHYDIHLDNGYVIPYMEETLHLENKLQVIANSDAPIWTFGKTKEAQKLVKKLHEKYDELKTKHTHETLMNTEYRNRDIEIIDRVLKAKAPKKGAFNEDRGETQ